jgi:uncharacterized protein involved in outer membrane biogenesis
MATCREAGLAVAAHPHRRLTFANPPWAREPQMVAADAVESQLQHPQLLRRNYVLTEVTLDRAVVHLEKAADGRKNWLLDLEQQDETARPAHRAPDAAASAARL